VDNRVGLESYEEEEKKKISCLHRGIEPVTVQSVAKSLYRLRYPGPLLTLKPLLKIQNTMNSIKINGYAY